MNLSRRIVQVSQMYSYRVKLPKRLESGRKIVSGHEALQVGVEQIAVVEAFRGRVPDRSVHPLHFAIRPRMLCLCEFVLNCMLTAHAVSDMSEGTCNAGLVCKLDAAGVQHRVQPVRNSNQVKQELGCGHLARPLNESDHGNLLVRSMPMNMWSLRSAVCTSAMSIWKQPDAEVQAAAVFGCGSQRLANVRSLAFADNDARPTASNSGTWVAVHRGSRQAAGMCAA